MTPQEIENLIFVTIISLKYLQSAQISKIDVPNRRSNPSKVSRVSYVLIFFCVVLFCCIYLTRKG